MGFILSIIFYLMKDGELLGIQPIYDRGQHRSRLDLFNVVLNLCESISILKSLASRMALNSLNCSNRSQPDAGDVILSTTLCQAFPLNSKKCFTKPPNRVKTTRQHHTCRLWRLFTAIRVR
jgi:hypothetical protein